MKLVECVPNFSEGRRPKVIEQLLIAIQSVPEVYLLGSDMDADHNRTVITFVGTPKGALEAAFRSIAKAKEIININKHRGEHPRLGVTDVCPFIPLRNVSMEECIDLAHRLGRKVHKELEIPVYLYEEAAKISQRKNLAHVRKGQFEKLKKTIVEDPDRLPDFGDKKVHPTAGAICIGARFFLIAYNVNLDTTDVQIAKKIARKVREKDGGLPGVKALGFSLTQRKLSQVSMNLVDYRKTSMATVFQAICEEAKKYGVEVVESEVVGLLPEDAILEITTKSLKMTHFKKSQVIENKMRDWMEDELWGPHLFLRSLASSKATPGGGSVAALAGATAAALAHMVTKITAKKKKKSREEWGKIAKEFETLYLHIFSLIREDSQAYQAFVDTRKMPQSTPEEKLDYEKNMDEALAKCILVPLDILKHSHQVLHLLSQVAEKISKIMISDVGIAVHEAMSSVQSSILTIKVNLPMIKDVEFRQSILEEIEKIDEEAKKKQSKIMTTVDQKIL